MEIIGGDLLIKRENRDFHCKRLGESDVPDWFKVRLKEAHAKMAEHEASVHKSNE